MTGGFTSPVGKFGGILMSGVNGLAVLPGLSPKEAPRSGTLNKTGGPLGFGGVALGDDREGGGVVDPETGGFVSSAI